MSRELDKAYDPSKYESAIYARWENSGAFKPNPKATKEPFTIIMPPPNSNGDIHVGTAMFVIEDIMARYRRMQGHPTLWLPGTDHAGIETQVVYERELAKEGKSRFDLGREQFYDAALKFTLDNQPKIIGQLRSLGFSADWSRLKFTLDQDIIDIVYATFKQMHDDGLIYRGNRIVNWCTSCQSSFADIEVKFVDRTDTIYTLDYDTVRIATTRPETIFADAAVAVHPDDPRYAKLIGQTAIIPLVDRPVAIIADDYVAQEFGTGALKVTPAHDKNDYEIGKRHNLPEISVVDLDGMLINVPEEFAGLSVETGRTAVVAALKAAGKLVSTESISHSMGTHDRCGTVIEPLITEQWYMRVAGPNSNVIKAIKTGDIAIVPDRFKKISLDWLTNEYDWNISRQNWFGIRIPVFYKTSTDPSKEPYLVAADEAEAKGYYGEGNYRTETDVFDTWYSSGQWPYATLQATGDFDRFYPTSVMETGRDILTKWVTKMAMFGLYRTGQVPFRTVYLHGLINDEHGKKMSKSKGNVINPLKMTAEYGTDALRLALTIGITPGNDGALSEAKIEGYRNFNNKLWNVARFILGQLPDDYSLADPELHSPADHWLMAKLGTAVAEVTQAIEEYRFSDAGQLIYSLLWDDFADWYLEASKVSPNHTLLVHALETILTLIHPIAPFVSEAIWSELPARSNQLITTPWPVVDTTRTKTERSVGQIREFDEVVAIVREIRTTRAELNLDKVTAVYSSSPFWDTNSPLIARLARNLALESGNQSDGLLIHASSAKAWLVADQKTIAQTIRRLEKQIAEKRAHLASLEAKLGNAKYVESAPAKLVGETRTLHAETLASIEKLEDQLKKLR
jgi:valyl-tRNA synthetase